MSLGERIKSTVLGSYMCLLMGILCVMSLAGGVVGLPRSSG